MSKIPKEFELIDLIRSRFGKPAPEKRAGVWLGIGDDAAIFKTAKDRLTVATTDTVVENIHFKLDYFTFQQVGHRCIVANLSDIAAMGGLPTYYLVTLGLREGISWQNILELYRGIQQSAKRYHAQLIGGDIVKSPFLFVSISLFGQVKKNRFYTRSGARVGDYVCVTGDLGGSLLGLRLLNESGRGGSPLRQRRDRFSEYTASLIKRHLEPEPRVTEVQWLISHLKIHGLIDISDGLSSELHHLARESKVGFIIDEQTLPIRPKIRLMIEARQEKPTDYVLQSGEEYELLFTVPRSAISSLERLKPPFNISIIGEAIRTDKGVNLRKKDGSIVKIFPEGFRHF